MGGKSSNSQTAGVFLAARVAQTTAMACLACRINSLESKTWPWRRLLWASPPKLWSFSNGKWINTRKVFWSWLKTGQNTSVITSSTIMILDPSDC